ncbi:MAG: type II toxin-antitoxin system ParD family antitoxin [Sphingomonas sp.]
MGVVRKLSIALTEELASEVDQAVAAGDYASTSEVIRDALRLWRRDRDADRAESARLRRLWEEGLASGEPIEGGFDPEDIARRGRARLEAWRNEQ